MGRSRCSVNLHVLVVLLAGAPVEDPVHHADVEGGGGGGAGEDAAEIVFEVGHHHSQDGEFLASPLADDDGVEQASVVEVIHDAVPDGEMVFYLFLVFGEGFGRVFE